MKILKTSLIIITTCLFISPTFAQGLFFRADAGYAFGMNGQRGILDDSESIRFDDMTNGTSTFSDTRESKSLSLGNGFNFGVTVGYMFNKFVGVDLGIDYLLGGKSTSTYKTSSTLITDLGTVIRTYESTTTMYSNMLRLMPSMVVTPGFEGLNPYMRFGVVLGFGSMYVQSEDNSTSSGPSGPSPSSGQDESKFSGGMAFGFSSALGANYSVSDNLSIFGEARYLGLSYSPTKSELTLSTSNGIDNLPNMTVRQKNTEYLKSVTFDENSNQNDDEPSVSSLFSFPYSSLGVNFGVRFEF